MSSSTQGFFEEIATGYTFKGESMVLGGAMLAGKVVEGLQVKVPLKTMNRHGLISGATGTGKTKTLQVIAEQLSSFGVPVLLMDIKGDLSGIAASSDGGSRIIERHALIGLEVTPKASPVELLSLSDEKGVRLRATVAEFGPVLFSKILGLNDVQAGVMAVIFKFCDDRGLGLLDLEDLKSVLLHLSNEGKEELQAEYGGVSTSTVATIMRKIVELEQQGAGSFFGEPSFEVGDLCRTDGKGRGIVSVLRVTDIQDRPKLFSTFMLQMLAEIYASFPEEGDMDKPKLVMIIDEAHLVFQESSKTLLNQIETIIKLIRSKGVGIFFCTQDPGDVPPSILGQLGFKVQHALRAFTAKDRKTIMLAAENYPETLYYETDDLLTQMGIGEALVSVLNEKGVPTPLVHTMLRAPDSRMDILSGQEIDELVSGSPLVAKYAKVMDRESAHELLDRKMQEASEEPHRKMIQEQARGGDSMDVGQERPQRTAAVPTADTHEERKKVEPKGLVQEVLRSPVARSIGIVVAREIARGLLGVLGLGGRTNRARRRT